MFPRLKLATAERSGGGWDGALTSKRRGVFRETGEIELPIYARDQAPLGVQLDGPAVIEQYDSTFVLDPGWSTVLDDNGQIIVTLKEREE